MLYKLGILFVILMLFLWFYEFNIKKNWLFGKSLILILYLVVFFVFTLSTILLLSTQNCVSDYVSFGLYSFIFSMFIFMVSVIVYTYNNLFEGFTKLLKKRKKPKIGKLILVLLVCSIIAGIIVCLTLKFVPMNLVAEWVLKVIFLPRTLLCGRF
jgi:uncharacterized membrane protein YbhN (UPF0104 family)